MALRGKILVAGCVVLAIITAWLWIHSSFESDEGLTNCNTLVLRRWGIAVGSWRGRIAFGHMDNPLYKYWNYSSFPDNLRIFGGFIEYQAVDDGQSSWDFDFDSKLGSHELGTAWRLAGFAFTSHTTPHDLDIPRDATHSTTTISVGTVCFAIPDYLIVALLLIYPAMWFRRKRTIARRFKEGLCVKCGYDLRGGHTACPECGAQVGPISSTR
jgi:hypothetical protein